jgi:hypothetical protein
MYLATVAYPDDIPKRHKFVDAVQAWAWKEAKVAGYSVPSPGFADIRNRDILRIVNSAGRIIVSRRFTAASWAFYPTVSGGLLRRSLTNLATVFPPKNVTTSQARLLKSRGLDTDQPHFSNRIWTPSKPVLHLAHALMMTLQANQSRKAVVLDVEWCVKQPDKWLEAALAMAEKTRTSTLLAGLGVNSQDLICLIPGDQNSE